MAENLMLLRPYLVMLAIVTVGRWLQGSVYHVPFEKGTHIFSIVTLTLYASLFYGALGRRWQGLKILKAVGLTMTAAVIAQLVILLSTLASHLFGIESYFIHPAVLGGTEAVSLSSILLVRGGGLVVNTIIAGIAGALGWALGALLPGAPKP